MEADILARYISQISYPVLHAKVHQEGFGNHRTLL